MKKLSIVLVISLLLSLVMGITVSAANTATLTGPDTVRAGDTITLTFNVNGSGIEGAQGELSYNSSQLTLSGTKQSIASPWAVEFNGNSMVAYDNDLSKPISKSTKLFTVTFKVNKSIAEGTKITVSYTGVKLSDGKNETNAGTISYNATIAKPLSGDCNLKALTVSNATISPAFSANTTEYTASVPFETSKLNVTATANDPTSKVTVDSPTLKVNGDTNVTVTVKAQTGATKTYTIKVHRAQDPNYKASTEAGLSDIKINDFFISPAFNTGKTSYVVYLPYETDSLTVTATNVDSKGSFKVEGNTGLKVGDNEIKVIGVAEDGTTEKVYTIVAKRAANPEEESHTDDTTTENETTSPDVTTADETTKPEEETTTAGTTAEPEPEKSSSPVLAIILAVAGLAVGFVVGIIAGKSKKN